MAAYFIMIDKYLIGKLKSMLILETSKDGEVKTLFLPKGVIIDFKISSDYDHYVSEDSLREVEKYIEEHDLEIQNLYYPD